jgi:CHAT domain-containing protein
MRRRTLHCLCLVWLLISAPALAQSTDVFALADSALGRGDFDQAKQQVLGVLGSATEPAVIGGAAMRLSHIAQLTGDLPAAEAPLRDALKRLPANVPAARPASAAIYLQLGAIALARGDTSRAQLALMKGVAIGKQVAPDDPLLQEAELTLATAEIRAFRLAEAATRLARLEAQIGAASTRLTALFQLAVGELAFRRYDFVVALSAQRKARDLFVALYGADHVETARAETALGSSLMNAGQYAEAAGALQHAVAIYDSNTRTYAPALAVALVNLGQVYYTTGRPAFAAAAFDRAIALAQQSAGPRSQTEAAALLHRGYTALRQNRLAAASADLKAAIDIWSEPATANPRAAAGAGIWLAEAERRDGQLAQAAAVLDRSAKTLSEIFGAESYAMTDVFKGLAELAVANQQPKQAIVLLDRALAIRAATVGPDHVASLDIRSSLALALAEAGDTVQARRMIGLVTEVVRQRIELQSVVQGGAGVDEVAASRRLLGRHVSILDLAQQATLDAGARADLVAESLTVGQLARASAAGQAIAELGLRQIASGSVAGKALRDLQAAVLHWQMAERTLSAAVAAAEPQGDLMQARRQVDELRSAAGSARSALIALDPTLPEQSSSKPASLAEIRHVLRANEALLSYLTLEDRSFLWVVTAQRAELAAIKHDDFWFGERIRDLRATVNPKEIADLSDIVPFATGAAADLYDGLIAPADLAIDDTHLIVVPDSTLQSLPFAALLSSHAEPPADFAGYRDLPWLIRDRDIATLPDIGALIALRAAIRPSAAPEPFLGIGDPLLAGTDSGSISDPTTADLLRSLSPLPEAADELDALAAALQAPPSAVVTSTAATEATVKSMPLQQYRVIAFATHGLVAGDFGRLREPGLVLTPPATENGSDDGLLTAGEIADLQLDADWVILSACNTAAADGTPGAEGLSGLARGFFFAGSRALLVSQWEVLSVAAVQLTTGTLQHLAAAPQDGRAAALRRSILALLAPEQDDYLAHPIFWAPFQLIGDSGAALQPR